MENCSQRREDTEMTHEKTQGYTAQTFLPSKTPPPTATQDRALSFILKTDLTTMSCLWLLSSSTTSKTVTSCRRNRYFFKLRNCLLKTQSSSVSCVGPVYLVIFCCWVGPVPYLELFWAGPVKKVTLYIRINLRKFE